MTESEWLGTADAVRMLDALFPVRSQGSTEPQTRKSRLYLAACARRVWDLLPPACRLLVEMAEAIDDPRRPDRTLRDAARTAAEEVLHYRGGEDGVAAAGRVLATVGRPPADLPGAPREVAPGVAWLLLAPFLPQTPTYTWVPPELHSADLLREVFGNPFARVTAPAGWRTEEVTSLAGRIHDTGDFTLMPILADALEDADCADVRVLAHCRQPAAAGHVRGCWVVDLLLGLR